MLKYKYNLLIILFILFLTLFWIIYFFNKELFTLDFLFLNISIVNNVINQNFLYSFLIFIFIYMFLVIFNFPAASLLSLTGGFLFGTWIGGVGIIIGGTLGSFIIFLIAKFFFFDLVNKKILTKYPKIPNYFKNNEIELMFLIRLIPGVPFFLQNLILAGLGANNLKYFFTTLFGLMPGTFIFASIGQGLDEIFYQQKSIDMHLILQTKYMIPIVFIICLIITILIYKKKSKKFI